MNRAAGQLGLFRPESDWTPPTVLPDLRGRPAVAIDLECRDTGIASGRGPGWPYGLGHVCGVSWAAEGHRGYVPIRHPDTGCMDATPVGEWLGDLFASATPIVFHNAGYDLGWIQTVWGVTPPETFHDTAAMAVMMDENRPAYDLDSVAHWMGVPGKERTLMAEAVRAYGGVSSNPVADLWMVPARFVGPYAEADAEATLGVYQTLRPMLERDGTWDAYLLERDLVPMIGAMRRRGVRIDMRLAEANRRLCLEMRDEQLALLSDRLSIGRAVTMDDVNRARFLEKTHADAGIPYPHTPTGQGSFQGEWMEVHDHWLPRAVGTARRWNEAAEKFLATYIMAYTHRGRLHADVHQFRSEEGGTRTHRMSYSSPPLQQMPSPKGGKSGIRSGGISKRVGAMIRSCFLPEEGCLWVADDYSQQEPRLAVHFAVACGCSGAEAAAEAYRSNPRTDFHQMVSDMTGLPRSEAKLINLGIMYGKGVKALADDLGIGIDAARDKMDDYHSRLPFVRGLTDLCARMANSRGYIRLLNGARRHFPLWEGGWQSAEAWDRARALGKLMTPCSREQALERQRDPDHPWHRDVLRRAHLNAAMNSLIQGSAAVQTKMAMMACWREGHLPMLQMHDELDFSADSPMMARRTLEIMRDVVRLEVPVVVEGGVGRSWGDATHEWEKVT